MKSELLRLYDDQMRRDAAVPGMTAQLLPEVTRYADPAGREGLIMWHSFSEENSEEIVARELNSFAKPLDAFTWKVYAGDKPRGLPKVLETSGMKVERLSTLMVCEASEAAELPRAKAISIRALKGPDEIHELNDVWEAVWPGKNGGWVAILGEAMEKMPGLKILIASEDGRPVGAGYTVIDPRGTFAYLGGGATLATHRGREFYRALVAERARLAAAAGTKYLCVEAGSESGPILARVGFEKLMEMTFFELRKA